MFNIFKKNITEKNWKKQAYLLWRRKKFDAPYGNIYYYYASATCSKYSVIQGHYELLHWAKIDGYLDELTRDLRNGLPQHLFENYSTALERFLALGEDPEYEEIKKAFEECDNYVFEYAEELEKILKNYMLRNKN